MNLVLLLKRMIFLYVTIKKIKDNMMTNGGVGILSYADQLLKLIGGVLGCGSSMEGEGSDLLEKVPKEALSTMDQNLDGPAIPLSDVELLRFASPWLNTLVVNVLNKWVSFRTLEAKLQRSWA